MKNPIKSLRKVLEPAEPVKEEIWSSRLALQAGVFVFERRKGIYRIFIQSAQDKRDYFEGWDMSWTELVALERLLKEILK